MRSAGWHRVLGVAALLLALAALVAVVLAVARPRSPATRVNADFPHPGIDFSIGVGTACDSTVGPAKCSLSPGQTFTLDMKLNSIPDTFTYDTYDALIAFSGVNLIVTSLVQVGNGAWPDCGFAAFHLDLKGGLLATGCAESVGASPSAYTGVLWHVDFQCPDTPTAANISLLNGPANTTDVVDDNGELHGEDVGIEPLTINCGNPPTATPTVGTPGLATPTNTPSGATPTPTSGGGATPTPTRTPAATPTPTPTPSITPTPTFTVTPTPTRRPHHMLLGDVDGDLSVDARDALWVLWFDARIVVDVPIPEAADVNGDGIVNVRDALLILQFDAGVIALL